MPNFGGGMSSMGGMGMGGGGGMGGVGMSGMGGGMGMGAMGGMGMGGMGLLGGMSGGMSQMGGGGMDAMMGMGVIGGTTQLSDGAGTVVIVSNLCEEVKYRNCIYMKIIMCFKLNVAYTYWKQDPVNMSTVYS